METAISWPIHDQFSVVLDLVIEENEVTKWKSAKFGSH